MLLVIIVISAGIYIGIATLLFFSQAKYVYYPDFPSRTIDMTPKDIGLDYEKIVFKTRDNINLVGWFIPNQQAQGTILFCHGNAGNMSHRLASIQMFHDLGLSTFIFDYRGYGESQGNVSERGTYHDVEAAWNYLNVERSIDQDDIIIFGRSLGGAIATWCAEKFKPRMLIIESTFTSITDIAAALYPYLPVRLLSRYRYKTAEYIKDVRCPVLIIHSTDDEIVPLKHGQKLFKIANTPKEFLPIKGSHNVGTVESQGSYVNGLKNFINKY